MSGMIEVAKATVTIVPNMQGAQKTITSQLAGAGSSAGNAAGLSIGSGIKKAIAAIGIGKVLGKVLNEGSELQQNLGGTEAVFGKHADKLQNIAKTAYKDMGLSASEYMATANKMGSLFQGSGVSQVKSLSLTTQAMQRAADVASVMGIDTSMAMESIAGAAKGNFTMMDNLGVAMNATTLQAYALEKGVNFKWNTASNAEKAELAMQMFMERTSQYEGNFARESEETFSGSLGAMKAAANDFAANLMLGQDIAPAMENLVTSATTFLAGNLLPAIGRIFASLPTAIGTAISTGAPIIAQKSAELITALTNGINQNAPKIAQALPTVVESGIKKISENLPTIAAKGAELLKSLGESIAQNTPMLASAAAETITSLNGYLAEHLPEIAEKGGEMLGNLAKGVILHLPEIGAAAVKIGAFLISNLATVGRTLLKSGLNLASQVAKGIVEGVGTHIRNAATKAKEAITKPITEAKEKIKSIFPLSVGKILSNIKVPHINVSGGKAPYGIGGMGTAPHINVTWAAKGLILGKATLIGAGEAGREGIIPLSGSAMRPFAQAIASEMPEGSRSRITTNNYYFSITGDNPKEISDEVVRQIEIYARTA